jgi:trehalose-6-phosphate synthase
LTSYERGIGFFAWKIEMVLEINEKRREDQQAGLFLIHLLFSVSSVFSRLPWEERLLEGTATLGL